MTTLREKRRGIEFNIEYGKRIKRLRRDAHMSIAQVAREIGVSCEHIKLLERGKPRARYVQYFEELFNTDLALFR